MKNYTLFSLLALTGLSACSAIVPVPGNAASAITYAITDVTIVDVEKGTLIPGQTVLVGNDRIDQIGAQGKVKIAQGATVIYGQGLYLMPGLVDAHVHYYDAPVFGRVLLANGVLLVRDMGMPNEYILPLRDQLNSGEILGPEMVAMGELYRRPRTRFVATFIGLANILEGRAISRDGAGQVVELGGGQRIIVASDSLPAAPGRVSIMIRPECIRVARQTAPQSGENRLRGRVESVTFTGSRVDYFVVAPGLVEPVRVQTTPPVDARPGEVVDLGFSVTYCMLLDD